MCTNGWTCRFRSITGYVCSRMNVQVNGKCVFTDGRTCEGLSRDMCVHGWTYRSKFITGYVCSGMDVQVKVYHGTCVLTDGRTG